MLLCQAHRTQAHRTWGCRSLGSFVANRGVGAKTFAKYKAAGQALLDHDPARYAAVLQAVAADTAAPNLPAVSKLVLLPRDLCEAVGFPTAQYEQFFGQSRVPGKIVSLAVQGKRFGNANAAGRELLRTIDQLCAHAEPTIDALTQLRQESSTTKVPTDLLGVRVARLKRVAATFLELAETLERA